MSRVILPKVISWPLSWPKLVSSDSIPPTTMLLLPPDWLPQPGETERVWRNRIGKQACAILNVLLPEDSNNGGEQ